MRIRSYLNMSKSRICSPFVLSIWQSSIKALTRRGKNHTNAAICSHPPSTVNIVEDFVCHTKPLSYLGGPVFSQMNCALGNVELGKPESKCS